MKATKCREIGCPDLAASGSNRCPVHQLAAWRRVPADFRERFAVRMVADITTNETGCWLFAGPRNPVSGYAVGEHYGTRVLVHRWMYWYLKGGLKLDHELHHVCGGRGDQDTRHCIRPAHLVQILHDDHQEETLARAKMLDAAAPGSRFHQTEHGEWSYSAEFARALDLPRHEGRLNEESSTEEEQVMVWNLVIPNRFQTSGH